MDTTSPLAERDSFEGGLQGDTRALLRPDEEHREGARISMATAALIAVSFGLRVSGFDDDTWAAAPEEDSAPIL